MNIYIYAKESDFTNAQKEELRKNAKNLFFVSENDLENTGGGIKG